MNETSSNDGKVQVCVRVRKALPREIQNNEFTGSLACHNNCVYVSRDARPVLISAQGVSSEAGVDAFAFDHVLGQEATQADVYAVIDPAVQGVLRGINATIFAYGQTSTGKTYTMTGPLDGSQPGVCSRAAAALFRAAARLRVEVRASFVQIYNERVMDLLLPRSKAALSNLKLVKDSQGQVNVAGVTERAVHTAQELIALQEQGTLLRETASQALNSESSRSHAVLTLTVTTALRLEEEEVDENEEGEEEGDEAVEQLRGVAKLHLVDLAGSERIKDSEVTGKELREAIEINKSLFSLIKVVKTCAENAALPQKKRQLVPYRESKLTELLSSAIGGNCSTLLIACVTPSQLHTSETISTLQFARACGLVRNVPLPTVAVQPPKKKPKQPTISLPWGNVYEMPTQTPPVAAEVPTARGCVWVEQHGDIQQTQKVALLLHAEGGSGAHMRYMVPCLLHLGYRIVLLDQPGCGNSQGRRAPTRSAENLAPGGPVSVGIAVLDALGMSAAVWIGFDWGGGAALSAGLAHPARVDRIVSFMPSYTETAQDELAGLSKQVLLLWIKQDSMHVWSKWQRLADKMPHLKREHRVIMSVKKWQGGRTSEYVTKELYQQLTCSVVTFLGGADPRQPLQQATQAPETQEVSTTGQHVRMKNMVTISESLTEEQRAQATHEEGAEEKAVREFRRCFATPGRLQQLYSGQDRMEATRLFSALPVLAPDTLQNESQLLNWGVWSQPPRDMPAMRESPRYFEGRTNVLVPVVGVCPNPNQPERFLRLLPAGEAPSEEQFTTHHTRLVRVGALTMQLAVEKCGGGEMLLTLPSQLVTDFNQPHVLPHSEAAPKEKRAHTLQLEDGLVCDYTKPLMKAKMLEIALSLEPLVRELQFGGDEAQQLQALQIQLECVRTIRRTLDVVSFARGRDRERNSDNIAKMALHGQGHCHTLSSLMASFLYPWQWLLGLDLRYRGGYSLHPDSSGMCADSWNGRPLETVSNAVELHQWLEFTARPSMRTFVCDLWVEDADSLRRGGHDREHWLTAPIGGPDGAYSSMAYTHHKEVATRSMFPKPRPLSESDLSRSDA